MDFGPTIKSFSENLSRQQPTTLSRPARNTQLRDQFSQGVCCVLISRPILGDLEACRPREEN
jgi:hypothetical protein